MGRAVRRLVGRASGRARPADPARRPRAARRLDGRATRVRRRRRSDGDQVGVWQGAERARAGAPRALGRFGRPGRQQRHDDERRAVVHPASSTRRRCSLAIRTAGPCTSGSGSSAWAASCNGIALHGLTRPYGGTFLVFSDYMRPAVRMAALMELPVTFVWTHDSIGLGEDGPTHQPVEHFWALRAIPGPGRGPAGRRERDLGSLAHCARAHQPARGPAADQAEVADRRPRGGRDRQRRRYCPRAAT